MCWYEEREKLQGRQRQRQRVEAGESPWLCRKGKRTLLCRRGKPTGAASRVKANLVAGMSNLQHKNRLLNGKCSLNSA